jgi:signal transduction histidine kinase
MTIKRRIFISNVRTILVTLAGLFLAGFVFQFVMAEIMDIDLEAIRAWQDQAMREMKPDSPDWYRPPHIAVSVFIISFVVIISIINNLFNYRLIKNIVRPLRPLNEGVRQIHDNNLAFRIEYGGNDEYRPICNAFNEMAARLEASAEQKRRDELNRRELIAGISHDLRTPLTTIQGCLEGLETGVASTPQMREHYFATIKNKAAAMEQIIEQLFLFSKLDMDEFPLTMRRVPLAALIADIIEEAAPEYERRGLDIHIAEGRRDLFVVADTLWLRNVLINILENSLRYKIKERAAIEIRAGAAGARAELRLADDGPGVDEAILPKLFDVFYRADPSRSVKGSGLGLAISKKIIERMGGDIHAELPDSGGLAIVIRLPAARD